MARSTSKNSTSSDESPQQQQQQLHPNPLTHTNLDSTCCDTSKGLLARLEYQRTLLTSLNPWDMDPVEGCIVFGLIAIFWTCIVLYLHAFFTGFWDGFVLASTESLP